MKQSTKVLLPLGLFMSVVIPIGVKSIFMETDFFEESSGIDYMQPYKSKPEDVSTLPKVRMGEDGLEVDINSNEIPSPSRSTSRKSSLGLSDPANSIVPDEPDFGGRR